MASDGLRHVSIDLETMSTRTDAAIVAIGAYVFDPLGDDRMLDEQEMFHIGVSLESSIQHGLRVTGETVEWWLGQSDGARQALVAEQEPLDAVLVQLTGWIERGGYGPGDVVLWSHAGFDFPILDHAYDVTGIEKPYWYRSPRDLRTIIHAAYGRNLDVEDEEPDFPANPVEHHAGYDAWHQAVAVQYCFRRLSEARS